MRYSFFMIIGLCLTLALAGGCKTGKGRAGKAANPTMPGMTLPKPKASAPADPAKPGEPTSTTPAAGAQPAAKPAPSVPAPAAAGGEALQPRPVLFLQPALWVEPRAALIFLHDAGSDPHAAAGSMGLEAAARDAGLLLVVPQGSGPQGALAWNAGGCCGEAASRQTPDAAWLVSLIQTLPGKFGVDPQRIYLAGRGAGGMMAGRMACERAELLAGLAVVGAGLDWPGCAPSKTLPMLQVHSMEDERFPYFGGEVAAPLGGGLVAMNSAIRSATFWARSNHCAENYSRATQGSAIWERFQQCAGGAEVTLLSLSVDAGRNGDPYAGYPVGFKILEFFGLTKKWDFGRQNSIDVMPGLR